MMFPEWALILAIVMVSLTSLGLLLSRDWRLGVGLLAIQYVGVLILVSTSWQIELAVAKMVAGWMAGAVLGVAIASLPGESFKEISTSPAEFIFRFLSAGVVGLVLFSIVPNSTSWFAQINFASRWGGLILIGMGLLHLGFTNHPLRITFGLLTFLAGFEILYAAVETSTLVAGLMAVINLGLALVCAYLMLAPHLKERE